MLPQFFARRYLFSPKSRSVVNLISGLSVVAVAMPVAAMIILLSVFNGFESLVKSMYSAFAADLTVSARLGQTFPADAIDTAAVARIPGVEAGAGHAVTGRKTERMLRRSTMPAAYGSREQQQVFESSLHHRAIGNY